MTEEQIKAEARLCHKSGMRVGRARVLGELPAPTLPSYTSFWHWREREGEEATHSLV